MSNGQFSDNPQRLWMAVLLQAIRDLRPINLERRDSDRRELEAVQAEAYEFFEDTPRLRSICDLAGIPWHWVKDAYMTGELEDLAARPWALGTHAERDHKYPGTRKNLLT